MRIRQALPGILGRQYPVARTNYPLLTVLYLLRMKDVDAVPIFPMARRGARAVLGFSVLPHLMKLGPNGFANFVRGPCEGASDELSLLGIQDDLEALLEAFEARRLGFALVRDPRQAEKASLASLADVLSLYGKGGIRSNLTVGDVGTPVFSMPSDSSIRDALQQMFRHRHRRVFLSGESTYVSDRGILGYLFSPSILGELGTDETLDPLSKPIGEVEKSTPATIDSHKGLELAALKLKEERGGCLVTDDQRVVTPWDVVMKPWLSGELATATS